MSKIRSCFAAATFLALCATNAAASAGSFMHGCAARDRQVLMLLEERETALSEERLNDAMLTMLQARMVCHDGRVVDAITLYDDIARSVEADH
jgi:hypothetical protein